MRINNGSVFIGGKSVNNVIVSGNNVSITQRNGRTWVNGVEVTNEVNAEAQNGILSISIEEGALVSVESDVNVNAKAVNGNVSAGGNANAAYVQGNVSAGGNVSVSGGVEGKVTAGGNVSIKA